MAVCGRFWPNAHEAENAARKEAANTGGTVVAVVSIRAESKRGVLSGRVLASVVEVRPGLDVPTGYARPRGIGTFHSWGAVTQKIKGEDLGYLAVQRPLGAAIPPEGDDTDTCFVSIEVPRLNDSFGVISIGPEVCRSCSRPISPKRMTAIPSARICTFCQALREQREHL